MCVWHVGGSKLFSWQLYQREKSRCIRRGRNASFERNRKTKKKKKKKRKNIYFNGSIKCIAMLQALRRNHNKSWPKRQCNNSAVVSLYSDFYCSSWRSFSSFQFGSVSGSFICFALFVLLDVCIAFFPCFFFGMFAGNPLHGYPSPSTEITNIICEKSENVVYVIYVLVRKKGEKFGVSV